MVTPTSEAPRAAGLYGRDALLADLERRVRDGSSLLTLVGPPGVGKTSLAVACCQRLRDVWPGGTVACSLSHATEDDDVASALARAARVDTRELGSTDAVIDAALRSLEARRALLVLDDAEAIPEAVARAVVRPPILVTSTRPVPGLSGDVVRVPPLDRESARALFSDRAGAGTAPGAAVTDATALEARGDLDALLERLERLPLAIELAAARARVMTASELTRSAEDETRLTGPSGATGLGTAVGGALGVLAEGTRRALAALSAFRGSFTLDAGERVLGGRSRAEVMTIIAELLERSLVARVASDPRADEVRFALSPSVRAHVRSATPERELFAADEAHRRYYAERAKSLLAELSSSSAARARARLVAERENLAAAFARSRDVDAEATVGIAEALERLLGIHGTPKQLLEVLDAAVEATRAANPAVRARALALRGWAAQSLGRGERATADLEEARVLAREASFEVEAAVLMKLGHHALRYGRLDEAARALDEAYALARAHDLDIVSAIEDRLGILALEQGRAADAIAHFEGAGRGHERRDDLPGAAAARSSRAVALLAEGRLTEARADIELVARWAEMLDDPRLAGVAAVNLGLVYQEEGAFEEAARAHEHAVQTLSRVGFRRAEATAHRRLGLLAIERGAHADATRALEAALAIYREHRYGIDESRCLALLALASALGGPDPRKRAERDLDAARALATHAAEDELLALVSRVLAREASAGTAAPRHPTSVGSFPEIVIVRRLVADALGAVTAPARSLAVHCEGDWFAVGDRATDLKRRGPMRRVLAALARAHAESRGQTIDVYGLLDAGWPGERLHPEAGAARVYETVRQLRRLGLDSLLVTMGDGYLLDPHEHVAVVDGPMPRGSKR